MEGFKEELDSVADLNAIEWREIRSIKFSESGSRGVIFV